jgi:hypothetical protein
MAKKRGKSRYSFKQRRRQLILDVREEITIDIYEAEEEQEGEALGEKESETKNPEKEEERVAVGFNIGWLLDHMPEDAQKRLTASLGYRAKSRECPHIECEYWIRNYCATLSTYRKCANYLKDNPPKSRKYHRQGFKIGVEISAMNIK